MTNLKTSAARSRLYFLSTMLLLGFVFALQPAGSAEEPVLAGQAIQDEMRIMSKVMEEELDSGDLADWRGISVGFSPFQPIIRTQYIPKVGAIFTIPVSFPLIEPKPEPPEKESATEVKDLWEKHASESPKPSNVTVPKSIGTAGQQYKYVLGTGDLSINMPKISKMQEYDSIKVQTLRQIIMEILAEYGYRMEHLGSGEKILIVIEFSPLPTSFSVPNIGFIVQNALNGGEIRDEER
ncbi:MAG: hypothetical protein JW902_02505, partial [Syntrophaceae bacterium]|nr:hypothetical protein [Syntrophaceae bacterium]